MSGVYERLGLLCALVSPHRDPVQVCWSGAVHRYLAWLIGGSQVHYNVMNLGDPGHISKGISGLFLCLMSVLSMAAADSERGGETSKAYRFWRGQTQAPKSLRRP